MPTTNSSTPTENLLDRSIEQSKPIASKRQNTHPPLLLGVDIGTYSSKGVVTNIEGNVIAQHFVEHGLSFPAPGQVEQDADGIWWNDFREIVRNCLNGDGVRPDQIASVGISSMSPCLLPIDDKGKPLRPGILYGIDTRAVKEIAFLEETIGVETIFSHALMSLSSHSICPKILWIKKNEPEVFKKTATFLSCAGYLVYRLTGEATLDIYDALCYGPVFDMQKKSWIDDFEKLITPLSKLPDLRWTTEIAGHVTNEASAETGLLPGTPVITGTADAAAEALSAGVSKTGDLMIMYGSSNFIILQTESLVPSKVFWPGNFLLPDTYVLTGGMATSGSVLRWFTEMIGSEGYAQLDKEAAQIGIGSGGCITLPYFQGERTPLNDPYARGVFFGLTLDHTQAHMYRSIIEGIGFGINHNLESLQELDTHFDRILAIGGGTESSLLLQTVSDITGYPQIVPKQRHGACYGDAFLAGMGAGLFRKSKEIRDWIDYEKEYVPRFQCTVEYRALYMRYLSLYESLKEEFRK